MSLDERIFFAAWIITEQTCPHGWKGPGDEGAPEGSPQRTHLLLAVVGRVDPVVQAGPVGQTQNLLEQVSGEVLDAASEDEVADPSVLLGAVVAEVDEVLDVVVGADVLHVLRDTETRSRGLTLTGGIFVLYIFLFKFSEN